MKEVKKYVCEKCGVCYDKPKSALDCENFHVGVEQILRENRERSDIILKYKYPHSIDVAMTDGKILRYKNPEEVTE